MIVNTFDDVVLNWATASEARFQFPDERERFTSAHMNLTIECPPGGCDPWDRFGNLSLKHSSGETYEIARLVTPYDIGTTSGEVQAPAHGPTMSHLTSIS